MEEYKESYLILFRAVTQALSALEQGEDSLARRLLIQGQQRAEAAYICAGEDSTRAF